MKPSNDLIGKAMQVLIYLVWGLVVASFFILYVIIAVVTFTALMNPSVTLFGFSTRSFVYELPFVYWGGVLLIGGAFWFYIFGKSFGRRNQRKKH